MPRIKRASETEALVKQWNRKADKTGLLHTVYSGTGDQYTGEWSNNLRHGRGTQVWRSGAVVYEGEWKCGVRDGSGTLSKLHPPTNQLMRVYTGEWRNNKKEGYGTYFYSSSGRYDGQWVADWRSGCGRMFYENGDVYEGEWRDDKAHGRGTLQLANGNQYEGEWRSGRKNGRGRFLYVDRGQLYEGLWVDDVPKCGTLSDYDREHAAAPTLYPIPQDVQSVLQEGLQRFSTKPEEEE
ncbi:MORN repeat-containing protein 3 isoform X2 [Trichomycterus rosablanca]|uniref:MORN repeat-containing protein 3 isoform X2 n=1 Tax=Trichomycterus rosablanca TaxID=2290929 RepID=UPI002F3506D4